MSEELAVALSPWSLSHVSSDGAEMRASCEGSPLNTLGTCCEGPCHVLPLAGLQE